MSPSVLQRPRLRAWPVPKPHSGTGYGEQEQVGGICGCASPPMDNNTYHNMHHMMHGHPRVVLEGVGSP